MINNALLIARSLAIAIAILGVIDPTVTTMQRGKPEIAVVTVDRRDSTLERRTIDALDDDFTIIRGEYSAAAATVIVGGALPDRLPAGKVFHVRDDATRLLSFTVPRTSSTEARLPAEITWSRPVAGARVQLIVDGVVVDTVTTGDASTTGAALSFTPTRPGALLVEARVTIDGETLVAHAVTDVVDQPRPVLFFDRRPSWMSTFVRRSLERDRRFAVASRVITSRGISTDAGRPPSTLADPALLELYDVIVVGAPGALTPADVAGLETFLRRRGGAVVLLYDDRPVSSAVDRLTGATGWGAATPTAPISVEQDGDTTFRLTAAAWPIALPGDATPELTWQSRALVWSRPFGAGQVIVNGALDSWKYRDPTTSRFDEYWRALVSRAAREAQEAVAVELSESAAEPGDEVSVAVIARDARAVPVVAVISDSGVRSLRVYPAARPGEFEGRMVAGPVGTYRVRATTGGAKGDAGLVIAPRISRAHGDESAAVAPLVRASGGVAGPVESLAIRRAVEGVPRREPWRPMRNGWWIVAFVGLLGVEWMVRRRRGLA